MRWTAMRMDFWEEIAATIPRPWPRPAAAFDLLWHSMRKPEHGRVYFEQRWGWTKSRVATLRSSDEWHSPVKSGEVEATAGRQPGADRAAPVVPTPAIRPASGVVPAEQGRGQGGELAPLFNREREDKKETQVEQRVIGRPDRLGKEPTTTPDPTPTWARKHKGIPSVDVMAHVVRALEAIRQRPVDPDRCKGDADSLLKLWKHSGLSLPCLADAMEQISRWARESDEAENDIRGVRPDGRRWGPDRSRMVSTLCVQERFGDRLDAAQRWASGERALNRGEHPIEVPKWTDAETAEAHAFFEELTRDQAVAK